VKLSAPSSSSVVKRREKGEESKGEIVPLLFPPRRGKGGKEGGRLSYSVHADKKPILGRERVSRLPSLSRHISLYFSLQEGGGAAFILSSAPASK